MNIPTPKRAPPPIKSYVFWISVIWCVWGLLALLQLDLIEKLGAAGDTFGALNALFSGLAFALLIYTATLQKHALEEQGEELKITLKEMASQSEQMRVQSEYMKSQTEILIQENIIRKKQWDAEYQPRLMLRKPRRRGSNLEVELINAGPAIYDLRVVSYAPHEGFSCQIIDGEVLDRHAKKIILFDSTRTQPSKPDTGYYYIKVEFLTGLNSREENELDFKYDGI